jgi:PilZ domain
MNIRSQVFGQNGLAESPLVCVKSPKGARADELLSIRVRREHSRHADTRQERRYPLVSEKTQVGSKRATHDIQLLNVCSAGAMITAPFEPALWDRLELHLGEHGTIDSSVVWIKNGRIGLEFARETRLDCAQDAQGSLLREVIHRHFPEAEFEAREVQETRDPDENRHEFRHAFIWSGTLHCEYGSTPARLRNVSPDGALIETSFELAPGADPFLDLGKAGSVFGTIVWSKGNHSGLKFHERFDITRLANARPHLRSDAGNVVRFGPPRR